MRSFVLAAFAALAALSPSSAFITAAPRAAATGQHRPHASLSRAAPVGSGIRVASAAGPLGMMMSGADTAVEQKGLVTVYHKDGCPYCKKTFELLEGELGLSVTRVNVLVGEDSDKKIKQMKTFSGRDTVPQVFFNSEHLGGNDDIQTLHTEGKLEALVAKVRAEAPGMMKPNWYHPWY